MKRVYWDSCCFIDFLQGSERGEVLKGVVDKKDSGDLEIVTSVVTLTEVIKLGKGTADLIDPTCHLVGTTSEEGLYGPTVFRYELSCGHTCHTDCPEPPAYCCECGCMVIA